MMIRMALFTLLAFQVISCQSPSQNNNSIESWRAVLLLNEENYVALPFTMKVSGPQESATLTIQNAEEEIKLGPVNLNQDSLIIDLPVFESSMHLKKENEQWVGEWIKYQSRAIPLTIYTQESQRFTAKEEPKINLSGSWQLEFSPGTEDFYPAIGEFKQDEYGHLTGTILTETGDYRYLEGQVTGNDFALSTFDGAHAFYFEGSLKGEKLEATFYSGSHWSEPFSGKRTDTPELKSAGELSYVHDSLPLEFRFPMPSGDSLFYAQEAFKGQPVLIQILGTWCPNCMDETRVLIQMQKEFPDLKILGLAFERSLDTSIAYSNIRKMKSDLQVSYPIALAGTWSKKEAGKALPFLSSVVSYPTLIFIDRNGEVSHVHTGFSGPGTGKHFDKTKEELRNELLKIYPKGK